MLLTLSGSGGSYREDSSGRRAEREAATRQLSELLNRLRRGSERTWDQLATDAHVSRNTVRNYLGDTLRNRDRATLQLLLDAMHAPGDQRAEALELLRRTRDDAPPLRRPPACVVVGRLPELAVAYQDRDEASVLAELARPGTATVLTQGAGQTVVSGLGGVGKTQLAARWARKLRDRGEVELLLWVRAGTASDIIAAYADAALTLALPGAMGAVQRDLAGDARRFLGWLAATDTEWAVVLDNLDEPDAIRELWPPATAQGRTVITTRRRDASLLGGRAVVDVKVFTATAAVAFLTDRLPARLVADGDAVEGVAQDLGRLPLGLSHAAAYMIEREMSCARYRERFADRRRRLTELFPDEQASFDDVAATVASTWALSIEAADAITPRGVAGRVLELVSLLDPAGIPLSVFTAAAALDYCRVADPEAVEAAVTNLLRFSLITRTTDPAPTDARNGFALIGVHALVQRTVRDYLDPLTADRAARAVADALWSCWLDLERDPIVARCMRTNTHALRDIRNEALWSPAQGGHPILARVVHSFMEGSLVVAAEAAASDLVESACTMLGLDHPYTLTARGELASLRGLIGDPAGAVMAFERLLVDYQRVLGLDHPDSLTTRHRLARWRGQAGDPTGAVAAYEQLLADRLRVSGPDDPSTLMARNELAIWRGRTGQLAGAIAAFEQLLVDRLRVLGPDHPDTLMTRLNLVYFREQAGDPADAVAAYEQLLADYLRLMGPEHPFTFNIRHHLAHHCGQAGDATGAVAAFEQLLADRLRVSGPDDPDTLIVRRKVADWRLQAGDRAGAVAAYGQLLIDQLRVLGPDHADTLTTHTSLAYLRRRIDGSSST